jgi:predicted Zn finger-like uncharacterized protein
MKFTCDKCHTKYSIADERVKGRVLKIRCKTCNNVITVREEHHAAAHAQVTGHTAPVQLTDLEGVFDKKDDEHTVVSSGPGAMNDFGLESDEWYVSFDGEQEGPFPLQRAIDRVKQERPRGKETHCWKPGFFVWLPVEEVPEFGRALRPTRPPAIPAAARSAPPPRPTGPQRVISPIKKEPAAPLHKKEPTPLKREPLSAGPRPSVKKDPTGPRAALAVADAVPGSSSDSPGTGPVPLPPPPEVPSAMLPQVTRPESASAYRRATGSHAAVAKAPADAGVVKKPPFPSVGEAAAELARASSTKLPAVRTRKDEPALGAKDGKDKKDHKDKKDPKDHKDNGFVAPLTASAGGAATAAAEQEEPQTPDTGPVPLPPPPGEDLPIGEASGLLNLSHIKGISGVRPRPAAVVETFGGVPVTSTPVSSANGAGSSTAAAPVVVVAGPAPSSTPPWMKYAAIAGIAMTGVLLCVIVYLVTRPPVVKTVEVETPSRKVADNPIAMVDPATPQPSTPDPHKAATPSQPRHLGTKTGAAPASKNADPQKGLSSAQRSLAQLYGETETAQPRELPGASSGNRKQASVSESQLASVVQQNKPAMSLCYQRVLKHDPSLKSAKMVAKVKIGISGRVTNVSFADPGLGGAEIGQCLSQTIKRWNFPASDSEYDFEFPIVLTAN